MNAVEQLSFFDEVCEENPKYINVSSWCQSELKPLVKKTRTVARTTEYIEKGHSASSFRNRDEFDNLILDLYLNGEIHKAALLIFGCNTGYRAGDCLSFRVKDLTSADGKIRDYISVIEDKTNKLRTIWLNKAVKLALNHLITAKHLSPDNFLFVGDGNKRSYIEEIEYVQSYKFDEEGNKVGVYVTHSEYDKFGNKNEVYNVKTTFEKYDRYGNERERAAMLVGSVTRWLKTICGKLGFDGKYSSHTMRQTFSYFISQGWDDNRSVMAACASFGHSSSKITLEHYMGIDPTELKKHQLELNLGLDAIQMYINESEEK